MKRIAIIVCLIMSMVAISPVSANEADFQRFMKQLANEFGKQRPDAMIETNKEIIILFALVETMKQFHFSKETGEVKVKQFEKPEDSTKSPFHKEPLQRLREAIAIYGSN